MYAQINILTVISARGPLVCAGNCIYIIILSFRLKGGPSRVLRASTAAVDLSGDEGRARQPCCARARGCVYVPTHVWVGGGAMTPKLFSRENAYCALKNRFHFVLNEYDSAL